MRFNVSVTATHDDPAKADEIRVAIQDLLESIVPYMADNINVVSSWAGEGSVKHCAEVLHRRFPKYTEHAWIRELDTIMEEDALPLEAAFLIAIDANEE